MRERVARHNAEQQDGRRSETADAQAYIRPPNGGTSGGAVLHGFAHDVIQPVARLNRPRQL